MKKMAEDYDLSSCLSRHNPNNCTPCFGAGDKKEKKGKKILVLEVELFSSEQPEPLIEKYSTNSLMNPCVEERCWMT